MCCFSSFSKQTAGPPCPGPHNCPHKGPLTSQKPSPWGGEKLGVVPAGLLEVPSLSASACLQDPGCPHHSRGPTSKEATLPRGKMKLLAHPGPWKLGRQAPHWEPLASLRVVLSHNQSPQLYFCSCSPTRQAGGDSTHNSWSIFSLHQNNLTADGRRHPQCSSSSPWEAESTGLPGPPGSHSLRVPWAAKFQKAGLSNG